MNAHEAIAQIRDSIKSEVGQINRFTAEAMFDHLDNLLIFDLPPYQMGFVITFFVHC